MCEETHIGEFSPSAYDSFILSAVLIFMTRAGLFVVHQEECVSHSTNILHAVTAVVRRQGEAQVPVLLPAAADLSEVRGDARQEESEAAHQNHHRKDQHQHESRRQVEAVVVRIERSLPAEDERVGGGHE